MLRVPQTIIRILRFFQVAFSYSGNKALKLHNLHLKMLKPFGEWERAQALISGVAAADSSPLGPQGLPDCEL